MRRRKARRIPEEEEEKKPLAIKELYPDGDADPDHLTMVTDTPPHMVMPLVRMKLVEEALNPKRTESLISIFVKEFDRRMISRSRKGRDEFIQVIQAQAKSEEEDELELN